MNKKSKYANAKLLAHNIKWFKKSHLTEKQRTENVYDFLTKELEKLKILNNSTNEI